MWAHREGPPRVVSGHEGEGVDDQNLYKSLIFLALTYILSSGQSANNWIF